MQLGEGSISKCILGRAGSSSYSMSSERASEAEEVQRMGILLPRGGHGRKWTVESTSVLEENMVRSAGVRKVQLASGRAWQEVQSISLGRNLPGGPGVECPT